MPPRSHDVSKRLTLSIAALIAALFVAAWWNFRQHEVRTDELNTAAMTRSSALTRAAETDDTLVERGVASAGRTSADAAGASAIEVPGPTGTLVVRVVDDATDKPLAEIPLRVGRERGGGRLLATGTSDARGEARFENVEANTVIVEASRSAQHARGFTAAWLEQGEEEIVVVRLGIGTIVRGRVVDDVGEPIEGADVLDAADTTPRFEHTPALHTDLVAARTGPDGRFEVARLAPEPHDVWIEHGTMAPRGWSGPRLVVRFEDGAQPVSVDSEAGAEVDVGDIVLARGSTWGGRVFDENGNGVIGAVVTVSWPRTELRAWPFGEMDPARTSLPGDDAFRLQPGEALTDGAGAYELHARFRPGTDLVVWNRARERYVFPWPKLLAGDRRDGCDLHTEAIRILTIELLDTEGKRVTRGRPGTGFPSLSVRLRLADGEQAGLVAADAEGLFRVQFPRAFGDPVFLQLQLDGYATVEHALDRGTGDCVRLTLHDALHLALNIRFEGLEAASHPDRVVVLLLASVASPMDGTSVREAGLGGAEFVHFGADVQTVRLDVAVDAPYFVDASVGPKPTVAFGPWRPGPDVHDIALPASLWSNEAGPTVNKARLLRASVVDETDGSPLEAVVLGESSLGSGGWDIYGFPREKAPEIYAVNGNPRRIRIFAPDHRATEPMDVELTVEGVLELGTIRLARLPEVELIVTNSDGEPPEGDLFAALLDANGRELRDSSKALVAGRARCSADPDDVAAIRVVESMRSPTRTDRRQTLTLRPDATGRIEARLMLWVSVEVRVPMAGELERKSALNVYSAAVEGSVPSTQNLTEMVPDADARRFRGWAAAGKLRFVVEGPLVPRREETVELPANGPDPVVVVLTP